MDQRMIDGLDEFARWVAGEILDEAMWEYNYARFAEVACRKLTKLGYMDKTAGYYHLPEDKLDACGNCKYAVGTGIVRCRRTGMKRPGSDLCSDYERRSNETE